jgi:endonuclease/exonuclease/phosphatase family metal-dependent hydrolase
VLTVANFNMHAGIDGWGRPFDALAVCRDLDADVLVLEESWTSGGGGQCAGQAEQIARALGYTAFTCALAEGRRARPDPAATDKWMPPMGLRSAANPLMFESERPLAAGITRSGRYAVAEKGSWGVAVLVRQGMAVEGTRTLHLPRLVRDRVRRAAVVVDLALEGKALSVVGTHMSHLHMGSHRHYRALRELLHTEARPDALLLGDMNLWGPPVRAFLPEWHRAVRGRTWPSQNPHSQIDHILVRGPMAVIAGEVWPDAGSDHRPVRAVLSLDASALSEPARP